MKSRDVTKFFTFFIGALYACSKMIYNCIIQFLLTTYIKVIKNVNCQIIVFMSMIGRLMFANHDMTEITISTLHVLSLAV